VPLKASVAVTEAGATAAVARASALCMSVTLVHSAEAVGRNEMPFEVTLVWPQVTQY